MKVHLVALISLALAVTPGIAAEIDTGTRDAWAFTLAAGHITRSAGSLVLLAKGLACECWEADVVVELAESIQMQAEASAGILQDFQVAGIAEHHKAIVTELKSIADEVGKVASQLVKAAKAKDRDQISQCMLEANKLIQRSAIASQGILAGPRRSR